MSAIPGIKTTFELVKAGSGAVVAKGSNVTVHATVRPYLELCL
jgi:hypothetical protein